MVSSSEAFLFCESSCIKSIAACPFKTGVGAIGFAIIVIIFYIFAAKIHIYSDICKEIEEKVIDEGFFYLTSPLLLGDFRKSSPVPFFTVKEGAPPLPRLPLLRRGLQPVNRLFCTRKQALAPKGVARDYLRNRVASV